MSEDAKLITRVISFELTQQISPRYIKVTDGRTNELTIAIPRFALRASRIRAVKTVEFLRTSEWRHKMLMRCPKKIAKKCGFCLLISFTGQWRLTKCRGYIFYCRRTSVEWQSFDKFGAETAEKDAWENSTENIYSRSDFVNTGYIHSTAKTYRPTRVKSTRAGVTPSDCSC